MKVKEPQDYRREIDAALFKEGVTKEKILGLNLNGIRDGPRLLEKFRFAQREIRKLFFDPLFEQPMELKTGGYPEPILEDLDDRAKKRKEENTEKILKICEKWQPLLGKVQREIEGRKIWKE